MQSFVSSRDVTKKYKNQAGMKLRKKTTLLCNDGRHKRHSWRLYKTCLSKKILPGLLFNLSIIPHQLGILTLLEKLFSLIILIQVEITVKVNLTNSNLKMLQRVTPATHSIHPRLSSPSRTYTLPCIGVLH